MPEIEAPLKLHLPTPRQLRAVRSWLGITQTQFAEKAGVSLSTITDFEKEHRDLGHRTLYDIAKAIYDLDVRFTKGIPELVE